MQHYGTLCVILSASGYSQTIRHVCNFCRRADVHIDGEVQGAPMFFSKQLLAEDQIYTFTS